VDFLSIYLAMASCYCSFFSKSLLETFNSSNLSSFNSAFSLAYFNFPYKVSFSNFNLSIYFCIPISSSELANLTVVFSWFSSRIVSYWLSFSNVWYSLLNTLSCYLSCLFQSLIYAKPISNLSIVSRCSSRARLAYFCKSTNLSLYSLFCNRSLYSSGDSAGITVCDWVFSCSIMLDISA
jgi:hypothetical protein